MKNINPDYFLDKSTIVKTDTLRGDFFAEVLGGSVCEIYSDDIEYYESKNIMPLNISEINDVRKNSSEKKIIVIDQHISNIGEFDIERKKVADNIMYLSFHPRAYGVSFIYIDDLFETSRLYCCREIYDTFISDDTNFVDKFMYLKETESKYGHEIFSEKYDNYFVLSRILDD